MHIKPTSADSVPPSPMPPSVKQTSGKHALHQSFIEVFEPEQFQTISEAWKNNPEMRSEVMATARQLAIDPNYPTPAQLQQLAQMIVGDMVPLPPTVKTPPNTEPPVTEPPVTEPPVTDPPVSATDL